MSKSKNPLIKTSREASKGDAVQYSVLHSHRQNKYRIKDVERYSGRGNSIGVDGSVVILQ